ncbi:TIGR01777 family oxidoreductase [Haloferula chungangensis]|uniref:TIGR01777 family oxidoreductase n=1 Tax=Haloferula chungangensis TaxID=1048331 RepID=A0ABW2LAZ9_9BACT
MKAEMGKMGIVGASGFIGAELVRQASIAGWEIVGYSRSARAPGDGVSEWREWSDDPDLSGLQVIVNLAGEGIDKRWTESRKKRFRESRVGVVDTIVGALEREEQRPGVFLNGTAVGIYGDRGDELLDERAAFGDGYLAELCRDWEKAADRAADLGVRVLQWRTGVVFGHGGAAWTKMRAAFSLGAGGRLGKGGQWMPWIHLEDLVAGMLYMLGEDYAGPVNSCAPEPERNRDLTRKFAAALKRPAFMHVPAWALKLVLGGFAESLLASQHAVPKVLLERGFKFRYPTLEAALSELVVE